MYHRDFWFIFAGFTSVWLLAGSTRANDPKAEPDRRPRLVAQLGIPKAFTPWRSRRTASWY